jgi:N6-adenosine-specific RNA methylase IME4
MMAEEFFRTFVADPPPWQYDNTATRSAAEDHHPTMGVEELCDLDLVREHPDDQAHLYPWTTASHHLPEAFRVMATWSFTYKTYPVWVKPQIGMGNYFRMSTELVLFGVTGGMPTQAPARSMSNWFEAKRGEHSAKPVEFHDLVRKARPGPYLELFSRVRLTPCRSAHAQNAFSGRRFGGTSPPRSRQQKGQIMNGFDHRAAIDELVELGVDRGQLEAMNEEQSAACERMTRRKKGKGTK